TGRIPRPSGADPEGPAAGGRSGPQDPARLTALKQRGVTSCPISWEDWAGSDLALLFAALLDPAQVVLVPVRLALVDMDAGSNRETGQGNPDQGGDDGEDVSHHRN